MRLEAGEEGSRWGDLMKADGEGIVIVSMEAWGNESFGLDIQAGTEGGVWSRLDVWKFWPEHAAARGDLQLGNPSRKLYWKQPICESQLILQTQ